MPPPGEPQLCKTQVPAKELGRRKEDEVTLTTTPPRRGRDHAAPREGKVVIVVLMLTKDMGSATGS
jgi:hypothetical protein